MSARRSNTGASLSASLHDSRRRAAILFPCGSKTAYIGYRRSYFPLAASQIRLPEPALVVRESALRKGCRELRAKYALLPPRRHFISYISHKLRYGSRRTRSDSPRSLGPNWS